DRRGFRAPHRGGSSQRPSVISDNKIERYSQWTGRAAVAVATKRAPDHFRISAVLDRDRERNRGVARIGIGGRVAFMIVDEELADPTIAEPAHGGGIAQARNLEIEGG